MKHRLPDSVASAQDLTDLILEVREYARWFEHESIKLRANVKHVSKSPVMSKGAADLIHEWGSDKTIDEDSLEELIGILKKYNESSPNITFTLAATPTTDVKLTLVGWCRKNIAPNVLVNFRFNSTLLGGMVVHVGSRIFDWSFRRQILAAKNRFPEVLRHV